MQFLAKPKTGRTLFTPAIILAAGAVLVVACTFALAPKQRIRRPLPSDGVFKVPYKNAPALLPPLAPSPADPSLMIPPSMPLPGMPPVDATRAMEMPGMLGNAPGMGDMPQIPAAPPMPMAYPADPGLLLPPSIPLLSPAVELPASPVILPE